jgi:nitrogen fixation protein NifB
MSVDEAFERLEEELSRLDSLRIVAVSGPGEPLANSQTIELFQRLREKRSDLRICLSTNGTLLAKSVPVLVSLDVDKISVSISAIKPKTAAMIYEWAKLDRRRESGMRMGERIIAAQMEGVRKASEKGITVKVNTILIPSVNQSEIGELAKAVVTAGADLQNIVPLVPAGNMVNLKPPSPEEVVDTRAACAKHMKQFYHCQQCRSDVVGIPGSDRIL